MHDTVQRGAHHLTQRASFDAGSDGLGHFMIVSVCGDADQSLGACDTLKPIIQHSHFHSTGQACAWPFLFPATR